MLRKIIGFLRKKFFLYSSKIKMNSKGMRKISLLNPQKISLGKNVSIGAYCRFECYTNYSNIELSSKITIGENTFIGNHVSLISAGTISIGSNCLLASYIFITNENHGMDLSNGIPFYQQPLVVRNVSIGNNCWIGEKAIILPGVSIGDNCIVGAGSVVTKSILSNSIVCGNPAKILKHWNSETKKWEAPQN